MSITTAIGLVCTASVAAVVAIVWILANIAAKSGRDNGNNRHPF